MNTATDVGGGFYDISPPIQPYKDGMTFSRLFIVIRDDEEAKGTWVSPVGADGEVHPKPLLESPTVLSPAAALAPFGYTLS